MLLSDIRTIIQQMATAFVALKGIGVIHTDVKLDNIMMVNHHQRPFEVKLIDFGLAIPTSQAKKFRGRQIFEIMSPEVFLGREFNEASDMWALGCAMFEMVCGPDLFTGECDYEIMLSIVELLGKPADHLLEKSPRAKIYFTKTDAGDWRIKSPLEFFERHHRRTEKSHEFQSLDDLKAMRLEEDNTTEAVEREQCIELLKAMLAFDADERITPREVLTHPFISKVYPSVQTFSEYFECQRPATPLDDEDSSNIQPDDCPPSPEILPSGVILVQTVTAAITTLPDDQESTDSEPTAAPLRDEDSSNIQPDDCTPSPEILPSGVILVRLHSSTENKTLLEDQELPVSFQSGPNKTSESSVSNTDSNRETSEDSTTCDTGPKKKGKKKKNCFRRVVTWLRKTISCCVSRTVDD
ncbi:homeodomain-interacting protein kinase 2-like isoform 2-T6 [Acanthopagrus schlegelii]